MRGCSLGLFHEGMKYQYAFPAFTVIKRPKDPSFIPDPNLGHPNPYRRHRSRQGHADTEPALNVPDCLADLTACVIREFPQRLKHLGMEDGIFHLSSVSQLGHSVNRILYEAIGQRTRPLGLRAPRMLHTPSTPYSTAQQCSKQNSLTSFKVALILLMNLPLR